MSSGSLLKPVHACVGLYKNMRKWGRNVVKQLYGGLKITSIELSIKSTVLFPHVHLKKYIKYIQ